MKTTVTRKFRKGTGNLWFLAAAFLVVVAGTALPVQAGSVTLTCIGYTGTETLANFQALIRLSDGRYGFHYADCADQTDGTDVWFSSDPEGNNVLEREIDTWNPGGDSDIWVKIPSLAAGTAITMHWGDASKAQPAANSAVWSGHVGVWHMGKATQAENEPDTAGNNMDATASACFAPARRPRVRPMCTTVGN